MRSVAASVLAACVAAFCGWGPQLASAWSLPLSECRQPVDLVTVDKRLVRRLEVHVGGYLPLPVSGCGRHGCKSVDMVARAMRQGSAFSVFGMTAPMLENLQAGGPLVGLGNWSVRGTQCFDVTGESTPPSADPFFIVFACDRAPPSGDPGQDADAAAAGAQSGSRCSIDIGIKLDGACDAAKAISHDGELDRVKECGPSPSVALDGCEAPSTTGPASSTIQMLPEEGLRLRVDGCGNTTGCRDYALTVLAYGGSAVDVFHVPNQFLQGVTDPSNLTHSHLYGLLGAEWQTSAPLPSRLEQDTPSPDLPAAAEVGSGGDVELCAVDAELPGVQPDCPRLADDADEAAGPAQASSANASDDSEGPPMRHLGASDPADITTLSRPVRCFRTRAEALPEEATEGMTAVVVCSSPEGGRCLVSVRQSFSPDLSVAKEGSAALRRFREASEARELLRGVWQSPEVQTAELSAHQRAEVAADAAAAAAAGMANEPECQAFLKLKDEAAAGAAGSAEADAGGAGGAAGEKISFSGTESLPRGAMAVIEARGECKGREECGDWEGAVALDGALDGVAVGGVVQVWATTLSGFRNATEFGTPAQKVANNPSRLGCAAASTVGEDWPVPENVLDGGVVWFVECRTPPDGSDECNLRYEIRKVAEQA
ncbi:hypothetical protein FNF31_05029 [Cafeteria roenbergensis]|uniref:TNase-like domain-containing protein n=1 Tax=Cafeteria roenbergensis TaxID=33653 RepID=A0A5A8D384_CAFRO|nr:hypothetical protein FNF31_05029 [Cafeteria roenbergensis]